MTGRNWSRLVIVDRVEPGVEPPYCAHGQTPCIGCQEWCWLGDQTFDLVASGRAGPLCRQCAAQFIPPGTKPADHVDDHR